MSVVSETIRQKTDSIAGYILNSSFWQSYQAAEQKMLGNDEVRQLLEEIRKKQEARSKLGFRLTEHPKLGELDGEIDRLLAKLEEYPEVVQFQRLQNELGECLTGITKILGWSIEGLDFDWEVPGARSCNIRPQS